MGRLRLLHLNEETSDLRTIASTSSSWYRERFNVPSRHTAGLDSTRKVKELLSGLLCLLVPISRSHSGHPGMCIFHSDVRLCKVKDDGKFQIVKKVSCCTHYMFHRPTERPRTS